jgi:hypothetical protein
MRPRGFGRVIPPLRTVRLTTIARWFFALAVVAATTLWTQAAAAYPWMIRHGYGGCLTCHADPSGGELLSAYGRVQGDLLLRMRYGKGGGHSATENDNSGGSGGSFDSFDSFDAEEDGAAAPKANAAPAPARATNGAAAGAAKPDVGDATKPKDDADEAEEEDDSEADDAEDDAADEDDAAPKPKKGKAGKSKGAGANGETAKPSGGDISNDDGPSTGFLWGLIDTPDWLLLGGSYRHLNVLKLGEDDPFDTFPMQADLYGQISAGPLRLGGSIGAARVAPGSPHARRAQLTTNQGREWNALSRTHWVGAAFGDASEFLVRAGRLNLPFGLRISEHNAWVREATRTDRESDQQHGVAFSYSGESFRVEAMAILGNYQLNPDRFRERGYSFYLEGMISSTSALGVSSMMTHAEADIETLREASTNREAHGVFARVTLVPPVVVMAELDALLKTDQEAGYVGIVQVDYEIVQGLHFMVTGEVLDQGASTVQNVARAPVDPVSGVGAGEPQFGGWLTVDWFFLPQLEARIDFIKRQEEPFTLLGQLHVYL